MLDPLGLADSGMVNIDWSSWPPKPHDNLMNSTCGEFDNGCYLICLETNYGVSLAISDAMGLWGLGSTAVNAFMSAAMEIGQKSSLEAANVALSTTGSKGFLYIKGFNKAMTLRQVSSGLALASKVSLVPMVAGTAYSVTARTYCYITCIE